jgi:hypothetical protein
MIKVKFECWWTDTTLLNSRIKRQFIFDKDLSNYDIVTENPDYTIVFGRTNWDKLETPKERTFYLSQEPLWSPNQPKDGIDNYCSKILISDKRNYPNESEYIETLLPMFYAGRGESDTREEWDWSKKIFNTDFSKEKSKKISSVVTNSYNSYYFQFEKRELNRIIYKDRVDTINKLIEDFTEIDVWGTYQPNNNINCHGDAWNKLLSLKEFKFSICFENTIQKNYISEKFWDCILTDTVPIYFGCSNILDYIPENCFINLTDHIDDYTYVKNKLSSIIENCDEMYNLYLSNIKTLKNSFKENKTFNLWERIKFEIESNEKDITNNEILD